VSVVCCQVEVSASGSDRADSTVRWPWSTRASSAMDIHSKLPTLIVGTVPYHDFFVDVAFRNDLIQFSICFVWETPRGVALCITAVVYCDTEALG